MPQIQYRNSKGHRLKGVTTVLNILAKPSLIYWGYIQGLENFNRLFEEVSKHDSIEALKEYVKGFKVGGLYDKRDAAADAGTLAHAFVENHFKGIPEPSRDGLPKPVIEKSESCYLAYLDWEKAHQFQMVKSEQSLVSEEWGYGGTIDIGAVVNELGIVDIKTSKDVYFSMRVQVSAYGRLWNENFPDNPIKGYHILRLGQEGDFTHHYWPSLNDEWEVFKACLTIQSILDKTGQKL